ncbi:MAG: tail fiber protein [bacterium]|nr:tail fiber protein [bacterium]
MNDLMAPVGSIVAWHKTLGSVSIPAGWVECNGQPISDTGGPYDGTDAPNLNGEGRFLRGSFTSGYLQDDAFQGHLMNMVLERGKSIEGFPHNVSGTRDLNSGPGVGRTSGIVSDGVNGAPRIDSETRPVNMSVVWIMRIK